MPSETDINPEDISDLWDYCFLVHTKDLNKADYTFTYLGPAVLDAYRGGLSGNDVNGVIAPHIGRLTEHYTQIQKTHKPVIDEGEFLNLNNQVVKYRQCLLPLGEKNRVDAIFGGMRYKIFQA